MTTRPPGERAHFEQAWGESSRWQSAIILIHPIGVLLYVLITFFCALIAAHGIPPPRQLAPLLLGMFCSQCTVGIANEFSDRHLDALAKPWRPIPAGVVSPRAAELAGAISWALSLVAAASLSLSTAALLFCGTASGVLYSVWLKRTPLSWLPYVVTYPGFPLWVWLALGKLGQPDAAAAGPWPAPLVSFGSFAANPLLWRLLEVYPALVPLALAAHLANQLRDYDDDLRHGMRGCVHFLGRRRSLGLCFALLTIGPLPVLALGGAAAWPVMAAAAFHWIAAFAGIRRYQKNPVPNSLRRLFRLLQLTGPLLGLTWLAATLW